MQTLHEFTNIFSVPLVQIAGGFICEQQCWAIHQRTRNCNALLFASGKLSRSLFGSTRQPHLCKPFTRSPKRLPQHYASNKQRHRHVFRRRKVRQKMVTLPDKPNGSVAILCQLRLGKRLEQILAEVYCTACWSVQRSKHVRQRTFPRA